jgi:proline iminopeptidase
MMASAKPNTNEVLGGQMDPEVYKEVMDMEKNNDFDNPKYGELMNKLYPTYFENALENGQNQ